MEPQNLIRQIMSMWNGRKIFILVFLGAILLLFFLWIYGVHKKPGEQSGVVIEKQREPQPVASSSAVEKVPVPVELQAKQEKPKPMSSLEKARQAVYGYQIIQEGSTQWEGRMSIQEINETLRLIDEALRENPHSGELYHLLSETYSAKAAKTGRNPTESSYLWEKSKEAARMAYTFSPTDSRIREYYVLRGRPSFTDVVQIARDELNKNPLSVKWQRTIAAYLIEMDQWDEGVKELYIWLDQAIAQHDQWINEDAVSFAIQLKEKGKIDESIRFLETYISKLEADERYRNFRGLIQAKKQLERYKKEEQLRK